MNNMWGSMAQYTEIYWPWPIAIYLFLAGLSAGAMMVAIKLRWKLIDPNAVSAESKFDACFKAATIIAPITICIGLSLLVFDLGKPLNFYWILLKYNFTSVMSIGVALLLVYTPFAFAYLLVAFAPQIKSMNIGLLNGLSNLMLRPLLLKFIEILLFILAIGVGVYTGFLLSAVHKLPLWDTPILPILFLVSGFSSGIAASVLGGMLLFKKDVDRHIVANLLKFDLITIVCELVLLGVLFALMFGGNEASVAVAKSVLSSSYLSQIFWFGVIGVGLILPIIIDFTALKGHAYKPAVIIFNTLIVITGVILLRYYIVYAGQIFTGA
ncbi:polysulfide reductase NrfD [Campylobacter sp. faydin G-24]|uniref:Polysulfide reductase NrfD n=1 Tax=Campylobacter anatolicus TaxID=2829105 RepID=A0ABS5HFM5_9BACT|nr:NrfD/PsrC family molybdoenzyme membrane anchor subunit [Campylobacter anatolicus]MBR8462975.1 polysulfide reductase NrfD [Campylobacter anatolicus]